MELLLQQYAKDCKRNIGLAVSLHSSFSLGFDTEEQQNLCCPPLPSPEVTVSESNLSEKGDKNNALNPHETSMVAAN